VSVGEVPPCVTVTFTEGAPVAETRIVATRDDEPPLASKVAVRVPLPVPEGVTVHHIVLLTAVQAAEVVTAKGVVPAVDATFWLAGVTVSVTDPVPVIEISSTPQ
jgi:hypothetical protein